MANFQGEKKKLRASLFHFGLKTCVWDWGTRKDRASLVQPTAAASKTDKIVCDLLISSLVGEDALGSCGLPSRGEKIKVLACKKSPWLKIDDAL